jgi:hypothetical protein
MNWGTQEILIASVISIVLVFSIYKIFFEKKDNNTVCPYCPTTTPCKACASPTPCPTCASPTPCPTCPTCKPYTSKTVREKLEELCPSSLTETRNGKLYIVQGNDAIRDEYLFGPCTAAGTCNSTNPDPISQTLINKLTKPLHQCGSWDMKDYVYDGYNTKKWVSTTTSTVYTLPGSIPITESFLTRMCDDTRKIILLGAYPFGATFTSNAIYPSIIRPICANMLADDTTTLEYKKEKTDWIFPLYDDGKVKMVLVTLTLKPDQWGTPSIYIYSRKAKRNVKTNPDLSSRDGIFGLFNEQSADTTDNLPLTASPSTDGYGLQNLTYSIYNKVRPRIVDQGYSGMPRGWFDTEGTGEATSYCRDVGPSSAISGNNERWISCVKENGTTYGTSNSPSSISGSNQGDYIISGPGISTRAQYTGKTPINLDNKFKSSLY